MNPDGRPKAIESPVALYELFKEYKDFVKRKPILVHDFVGKNADEVWREKEKPLTYEGFQNFVEDKGVISTTDHYFMNYQKRYDEFVGICSRIKREIRQDQIEGGMTGIYNSSITQRLNGLVEKTESKISVEQPIFSDNDLSDEK